jgi:hypothetical protein
MIVKREEHSSRFCCLWREHSEVQLAQALGIADDFDLGDLSVCEGEAEDAEEASSGRDNEAHLAVNERRLCGTCAPRGGDCAACPVLCAANFSHGFHGLGGLVSMDDYARIEHGEERVEVASAQSGEEGIDSFAL